MNIGEVLTKAWKIVWKFKVLWIFVILAGCMESGGGGGGGGNNGYRFDGNEGGRMPDFNLPPEAQRFFEGIERNPEQVIGIIAAIVFVLCLLWVVAVIIGTIGRIGLIKGAQKAEQGAESLGFGELWSQSLPYFWRVLGLWIVVGLLGFVLGVVIAVIGIGIAAVTVGIGLLCLVPLFLLLIPVFWAIAVIVEQATIAIVVEERGLMEGVQRGWELFRANLGQYILMALALFVIELVIGLVVALPVLIIVVPAVIAMIANQSEITTTLIIAGICFVAYLPVMIVLSGILTAYTNTAWTLTFLRLAGPAAPKDAPAEAAPEAMPEA
jgi:hypothetical protein